MQLATFEVSRGQYTKFTSAKVTSENKGDNR